jgi:hypothetical protein
MIAMGTSAADKVARVDAGENRESWTEAELQRLLGSSRQQPLITEQTHTACQDGRLLVEFNQVRNVATKQSRRVARVVAVDEANYFAVLIPVLAGGQFALVWRYRYPLARWSVEFPRFEARTSDEGWKQSAQDSLRQLASLETANMRLLGAIQCEPALIAPSTLVILAEQCVPHANGAAAAQEPIAGTAILTPERLDELARQGEIVCGVTLAALYLYGARMRR